MTTIREFIVSRELPQLKERLNKMEEINAPKVIIDKLKEEAEAMEQGKIKVGGATEKLDWGFGTAEMKKGNGGKVYWVFYLGGTEVHYFPNAKYGRFIK